MNTNEKRPEDPKKTEGVGIIGIDHRPCSLDEALYRFQDLADQCRQMAASDRVRVVVCRCGAKPQGFAALESYAAAMASIPARLPQRPSLMAALADLPQPVIMAVDGNTMGMELEVALTGDIRICSDTAIFGLPQISRGEIPCFGGTQRLARLVGKGKALEMILTGDPVDAGRALEMGLVNRVVPSADLDATVQEMAAAMAAKGPVALQFAKEAVNTGLEMPIGKGLRLEADLYFLLHTTRDRTEGIKAFLEKRKAQFEGQ